MSKPLTSGPWSLLTPEEYSAKMQQQLNEEKVKLDPGLVIQLPFTFPKAYLAGGGIGMANPWYPLYVVSIALRDLERGGQKDSLDKSYGYFRPNATHFSSRGPYFSMLHAALDMLIHYMSFLEGFVFPGAELPSKSYTFSCKKEDHPPPFEKDYVGVNPLTGQNLVGMDKDKRRFSMAMLYHTLRSVAAGFCKVNTSFVFAMLYQARTVREKYPKIRIVADELGDPNDSLRLVDTHTKSISSAYVSACVIWWEMIAVLVALISEIHVSINDTSEESVFDGIRFQLEQIGGMVPQDIQTIDFSGGADRVVCLADGQRVDTGGAERKIRLASSERKSIYPTSIDLSIYLSIYLAIYSILSYPILSIHVFV